MISLGSPKALHVFPFDEHLEGIEGVPRRILVPGIYVAIQALVGRVQVTAVTGVITDDVLLRALMLRTQSIDGFPFVETCLGSSTPSKDSADALPHWKTVRVGVSGKRCKFPARPSKERAEIGIFAAIHFIPSVSHSRRRSMPSPGSFRCFHEQSQKHSQETGHGVTSD